MNEMPEPTAVKRPMYQIWLDAVMKPTVPNYEGIAAEPGASTGNAALWLFAALAVGGVLGGLISLPFGTDMVGQLGPLLDGVPPESREALRTIFPGGGGGFGSIVCGAPIGALFGVVFYFIGTAIQSWIAKLFGGVGSFDKFFFVNASYYAPITLATSVLNSIPLLGCLSVFIGLYGIYLNFLSLQAVHKLPAGKAIMVILIPMLIACGFVACTVFFGLAILAPIINNVFQQISP